MRYNASLNDLNENNEYATQWSAQSLTFNNVAYFVYIESTGCPLG